MKQLCYLMLMFLMLACSGGDEHEPEKAAEEKPEKIFAHQTDSLDKAREVESLLLDRAKKEEKKLDNMSQ